jgi:hypothetical protein
MLLNRALMEMRGCLWAPLITIFSHKPRIAERAVELKVVSEECAGCEGEENFYVSD